MIPKIIHYCWFGRNQKSELACRCIESWKEKCPGYEIIEWNEDNFEISQAPLYVRQAYDAKKWAFVTDYVRLWAMTRFGGIYMDTDVEVIEPIDKYLVNIAFSGFDDDIHISTGIMACEKDFGLFKSFLNYYDDAVFINPDGSLNMKTNVFIMTEICLEKGFEPNGKFQILEGFSIYPKDVFCPLDHETGKLNCTKNTCTIHWFSGSWLDETERKRRSIEQQYRRLFGSKYGDIIYGIVSTMKKEGFIRYVCKRVRFKR